jgi:hypothetical protein
MEALTAKAALVDPATFEGGGNAITTRIPRSEVEEALRADGPSDLFIDVARVRDGDAEQREVEAEQRITVSWDPDDLEKLLASSTGDEVTFAFKPEELARMLDESEVEAHGLREKVAILTVAAATAAGASAGAAGAMVAAGDSPAGTGGSGTAAFVTDSTSSGPATEGILSQEQAFRVSEQSAQGGGNIAAEEHAFRVSEQSEGAAGGTGFVTDATSSGPQAPAEGTGGTNLVTDTTSSGPQAPVEEAGAGAFLTDATSSGPQAPVEATGGGTNLITDTTSSGPGPSVETASASGGGQSFLESTGGEAALAGGLALLILGAGFIGTRQRRGVQPA